MWLIFLALLVALVLVLGVVLYTYLMRGTMIDEVRVLGEDLRHLDVGGESFLNVLEAYTRTHFRSGNEIQTFVDGEEFFEHLFGDLRRAQHLITWHVFFLKPGRLADALAEILIDRARAGVTVLFLHDRYGSKGTPDHYFERLTDAGIEVGAFRPYRWDTLYKAQQRMHVRAVVIDGRIGYTGGFGIDDRWAGPKGEAWRETNARLTGPVVDEIQAAFGSNWAEAKGQLLTGDAAFPPQQHDDVEKTEAAVFYSSPSMGTTAAERLVVSVLSAARERLYIATGYFVPDRGFRRYLKSAAARGVDVRILTPGANTDQMLSYYAGVHVYDELLEAGIRIFHYRPTMMHAKTFIADSRFSVMGTLNFDNRSMMLNDEILLMVRDEQIAQRLEEAFFEDLGDSDEIDTEWLSSLSWSTRIKGRASHMISRLL